MKVHHIEIFTFEGLKVIFKSITINYHNLNFEHVKQKTQNLTNLHLIAYKRNANF